VGDRDESPLLEREKNYITKTIARLIFLHWKVNREQIGNTVTYKTAVLTYLDINYFQNANSIFDLLLETASLAPFIGLALAVSSPVVWLLIVTRCVSILRPTYRLDDEALLSSLVDCRTSRIFCAHPSSLSSV